MKSVKDVVERLSVEERAEIIKNYEEFDKKGVIGECLLRSKAEYVMSVLESHQSATIQFMLFVAMETYRAEYHRLKDSNHKEN